LADKKNYLAGKKIIYLTKKLFSWQKNYLAGKKIIYLTKKLIS